MTNKTLNKIILSATTAMFLTACGGGGSSTPTAAETASAKIQAYAVDGTNPAPTVEDYADVGITVTEADLTAMNALVDDKTNATDVDEVAELEALLTVLTADTTAPVVTPVHPTVTVAFGGTYVDAGATVTDDSGEVLTATPSGTVTVDIAADYTITYTATDSAGNVGTATTIVTVSPEDIVAANEAPVVTPVQETVTVDFGGTYVEAGATVTDDSDEGLTATPSGTVDVNTAGDYTITYTATDSAGLEGTATTVVTVSPRFTIETTTVKDTLTGLVWDKTASEVGACGTKSEPTIEQFQNIINYDEGNTSANAPVAIVNGFEVSLDDTHYKTSDDWDIRLKYGHVTKLNTATTTICVDASAYVAPAASVLTRDNATNEVTDTTTGLVWADDDSSTAITKNYSAAVEACTANNGMRLPTLVELDAIYDRNSSKIISGFDNVINAAYWTSKESHADATQNWTVNFKTGDDTAEPEKAGQINGIVKTEEAYFRCVKDLVN